MNDESEDPERPNNLYQPLSGDHGARGPFSAEAHETSLQWWVTKNRSWLALAALGIAGLFYLRSYCSDTRRAMAIQKER